MKKICINDGLNFAANWNQPKMVKFLLDLGAKPSGSTLDYHAANDEIRELIVFYQK